VTIASEVAVAHGGTLTIEDSPLGGARVTMTFADAPPGAGARQR
jgi:signal transduction histidine kinase